MFSQEQQHQRQQQQQEAQQPRPQQLAEADTPANGRSNASIDGTDAAVVELATVVVGAGGANVGISSGSSSSATTAAGGGASTQEV